MESIFIIDHTAKLGGGQLAIARYLQDPKRNYHVNLVLLEDGALADIARSVKKCNLTIIETPSKVQKIYRLNRLLSTANDLVVANSLSAFIYASLTFSAQKRIIKYLRQEAYPHNATKMKKIFLRYFAYPRAKGFLSNSEFTKNSLESTSLIQRCKVSYTISGNSYSASSKTHLLPFGQPIRVLSLSRISPWKGVEIIIQGVIEANRRAGKNLFSLTVAGGSLFGEKEYEDKLHAIASGYDKFIKFTGNVSDVEELLLEHDILASGSLLPEPFGQIIVQGISHGLLTIGTNHGGATEIIDNFCSGLLVEPGDIQHLASSLLWAASHSSEIQNIRINGLSRAQDFNDSEMIKIFEKSIKSFQIK